MTTTTITREMIIAQREKWAEEQRAAARERLGATTKKPSLMDRIKGYFVERKIKNTKK